ncbi:hypothetical protein [Curtobacterium sp. MCSS17_016]|uniref:hypothetical protein n=1 Tax=Curtobacterium sp. MCSS17_016 TaxID=2175644 RepID=UPI0024DF9D16|nr:hypothetical protein [Curtobacterium sp. MCSS17_016]
MDLNASLTPNVERILNDVPLEVVHAALISGDQVAFQTMTPYRPTSRHEEPRGLPEGGQREVTVTFRATVETKHVDVMAVNREVFQGRNLYSALVRWEGGGLRGARWTWRHVEFHDELAVWWKAHDPNQAS